MSVSANRKQRAFVPGGHHTLEGRLVLSAIGPSHPIPPPAMVRRVPGPGRDAIPPGRMHARPAADVHVAGHPANRPLHAAVAPTVRRWAWFADSDWYVPTRNLPAVLYNSTTNTVTPVSDQTVFQITGYREGYFWGKTVSQFDSSSPSASTMVGSVTPQGRVLLDFTSTGSSGTTVTQGFGQMRRKAGRWTMENQMFTSMGSDARLGHWAYMVPTHPGLASWESLPGVGVSVPEFLAEAGGSAPQPTEA